MRPRRLPRPDAALPTARCASPVADDGVGARAPARLIVQAIALLAALTIAAPSIRAQQPDEARRKELERKVLEAAQPGPEHERLASLAGEWDVRFSYYTAPGAAPTVGTGTATNRMILGGRFLHSESVTQLGDRRSESLIIMGYDRRSNRYTSLGLDNWGTYYVEAEGPFDEGSRAIVMYGEETDPLTSRIERYTMITRFIDANEYVQEIVFRLPNGESFTAVEVRCTRRK